MRPTIGLFSTVPVEVLLAAGMQPLDLNNLFVQDANPGRFLAAADAAGVPMTVCAWTRGLYGVCKLLGLERVVLVTQGDCFANHALGRRLAQEGVEVLQFAYPSPFSPDPAAELGRALEVFCQRLGTSLEAAEAVRRELIPLRRALGRLDRETWETGRVTGWENHQWLLSSTDLGGREPGEYLAGLEAFLKTIAGRPPMPPPNPRLGVFGVPTALTDLHQRAKEFGASVGYNESPFDFAMTAEAGSLGQQYLGLAWPLGVPRRLAKAAQEGRRRGLDGFVVYEQLFCHHGVTASLPAEHLGVPVLRLEGGEPGALEPRDLLRLEAFVNSLKTQAGKVVGRADRGPTLGLDLGSRFAKLVLQTPEGRRQQRLDSVTFYRRYARRREGRLELALPAVLEEVFDYRGPLPRAVAAGYGRHLAGGASCRVVTEIAAHQRGAVAQVGAGDFVLLDLGGQDSKGLLVRAGALAGFVMNDRCAAGGGRYVENMAAVLGLQLEELLACAEAPVKLNNICATFGESEVVGLIVDGVELGRIGAGVLQSVADRAAQMLARLDGAAGLPVYLAGGLARGPGLQTLLAARLGVPVVGLPEPDYNGALGCALLAEEA
jgi:predicted CoA-substrate-specific enzyme activase